MAAGTNEPAGSGHSWSDLVLFTLSLVMHVSGMREATIALRYVLPFLRLTGAAPDHIRAFVREGITLADFVDPDVRIRHRIAMAELERTVQKRGDPTLGLRAGEHAEAGDLDVLEFASRSCASLREATLCAGRYMYLMHGGIDAVLIEERERAIWQLVGTDDVVPIPAANDYAVASSFAFVRRYTGGRTQLLEAHFQHAEPTCRAAYQRLFGGATLRMNMPHNALVYRREDLDQPMSHANAGLKAAYEMHAQATLERLRRREGVGGRLRQLLIQQLASGDISMAALAPKLGMSVTTLRRRLTEEGTTHSDLLDELRRELAFKYLDDTKLAIREVAFLLGFAHVTAFYKAFRRWSSGVTPAEFRARASGRRMSA
jgi:AraC-like DNA-binding protein